VTFESGEGAAHQSQHSIDPSTLGGGTEAAVASKLFVVFRFWHVLVYRYI
jgi:hypothetical protein